MALFGRGDKAQDKKKQGKPPDEITLLVGRKVSCKVCEEERTFSKCWRRKRMMPRCTGCGSPFEDPRALYARFQPKCPKCEEPLEQPNFDYGFCDSCGSKHEIVEGTKPALMPNRQQRIEMEKYGKARSVL